MKKSLRLLILFLLIIAATPGMAFLPVPALAELTVSGKVTDATTNQPLPGVGVLLKQGAGNTPVGTVTDLNGDYTLRLPADTGTLQFSYIGYKNVEVAVTSANASNLAVKLSEDVAKLDEVVITGLATSVKR